MGAGIAILLLALGTPHFLREDRLPPLSGVALWLAVLLLRAVLAVWLVGALVRLLPATQPYQLVTEWCVHAALPLLATHLGASGHQIGDAMTIAPALALSASAAWAVLGIWRGARMVRRWIGSSAVAHGPHQSLVVGDPGILVAAAGIWAPRVVVSAGALTTLDDQELIAGIEHERGHIERRHRFLIMLGRVLFAIARPLPGSRRALKRLHFQLERDADEYAVRRTRDPLALARAICKAALEDVRAAPAGAFARLTGDGAPARLRVLLAGGRERAGLSMHLAHVLAALAAISAIALVVAAPSVAERGLGQLHLAPGEGPPTPLSMPSTWTGGSC